MPGAGPEACLAPLPYTLFRTHHVVCRHISLLRCCWRKRGLPGNVPSWSRPVFSKCVSEATRDSRLAALPGWPHHIFYSAVQAGGDPPLGTLDSCDDPVVTGVSGLLGPSLRSFGREPRWRSCGQCPDHCRKSTLMPSTRGVTWLWVILSAGAEARRRVSD